MTDQADQDEGQMLGKYEILDELGKGGFATVFRAFDTVLGREVALKILHPALVADPDFVRRFEDDARAAAQLDHPHIVTIHDLGQSEGRFYIAMQLLPGGTLAEHLEQEGPLPFERAIEVVEQVTEALDYAHERGFVHRDIKPSNILFDAHGGAVVTDFGLAKAAESSVVARSTSGGIVGTPAYIAPEVWEEKEVGPATDVYALGCVVFEMLSGQRMFRGKTTPAVMRAHFQPHEYPDTWPEGVPPEVQALLEKALAQEARDRYASAGALAQDLRELSARTADPLAERYDHLQEVLRQAQETPLAGEGWERALHLAQEIATQDPEYRYVSALRKQAAEARARAERAQWAAQWREQAVEAEREGDMDSARVAARRWLEMAPGDEEAEALLERVQTKPTQQATAEEELLAVDAPKAGPRKQDRGLPGWIWMVGGFLGLTAVVVIVAIALFGAVGSEPVTRGDSTSAPEPTEATMGEVAKPTQTQRATATLAPTDQASPTSLSTLEAPIEAEEEEPGVGVGVPIKAAFVYIGPPGDLGWTYEHDRGRKMLEEELGDDVETTYIEDVPEGPDAKRVIRQYAQEGWDVIFTTSFGYMDPTYEVAEEFPDVIFEHCSGYKTRENMATYFGRMYQPRYLSGIVAGEMTDSNIIGYAAAFPIPEVIRGINAFTLGVRSVNSDAEVRVVWTNTWYDPVKEREAAEALLDQGADIITQHQETTEPQKAAKERDALSIGYDSHMRQFVGDTVLTSPQWNWGTYYIDTVKAIIDGKWESHQFWGGLETGVVRLAEMSPLVPDDVREQVDAERERITGTDWDIFCGPIDYQDGSEAVSQDQCMSDTEMLSMDRFVEGVVGTIPE